MLVRLNTAHKASNVGLATAERRRPRTSGDDRHMQRLLDRALVPWQDYRYALLNLLD